MGSAEKEDIEALRAQWKHLYATHLPALARAKDPVQPHWPVHLDHCFGRIILDNAVGLDKPWNQAIKAPAVRNMTAEQLRDALVLGERVASGEADLVELDRVSLELRGKRAKKAVGAKAKVKDEQAETKAAAVVGGKRKVDETISKYFAPALEAPRKRVKDEHPSDEEEDQNHVAEDASPDENADEKSDMAQQIARIVSSKSLTPFRKQTLTLLCRIPRGRWSTYQAMSDYITATSHKTCARAVGNAMRNNPFAPEVPCHRILSSDGSIGGFHGHWGEEGKFAGEKKQLLGGEGVRFDSKGKVKGLPFRDFGK